MIVAICILVVVFALAVTDVVTRKVPTTRGHDVRQPTKDERLANWELRRGRHRAEQRLRECRVDQAFDARASVQPKITPRLP